MQVFEGAKWIWLHNEKSRDEYGEFFAVFNSEKENAVCRISCDGDYTLFINGSAAGSNQYGDFEHYKIYYIQRHFQIPTAAGSLPGCNCRLPLRAPG